MGYRDSGTVYAFECGGLGIEAFEFRGFRVFGFVGSDFMWFRRKLTTQQQAPHLHLHDTLCSENPKP